MLPGGIRQLALAPEAQKVLEMANGRSRGAVGRAKRKRAGYAAS